MGLFPIQEKVLSIKERNKLQDEYFGIPELKKYPMPDKNHVLSAMRYFNKCPKGYEKVLAKNIIKKAKEFNIGINRASDYYKIANENTIIITENGISNYTQIDVNDINIKKYKEKYKNLSHLRTGKDYKGKIFISKEDEVIGFFNVDTSRALLQAIEVNPKFRGQGFSKKLIRLAIDTYDINWLTVRKTNEIAIELYKKNGFKISDENKYQYTMIKENLNIVPNKLKGKLQYENNIIEESKIKSKKLYFLSNTNMDQTILQPRIPNNYLVKNGYEDDKTKRICFAPSIDKCLMGLSRNLKGERLCVHVAVDYDNLKMKKPTVKEVPDSKITGEIWILEPVELEYIGDIEVIKDKGLEGHKFKYGDNKEAELYDWEWKWIKRFDNDGLVIKESIIQESSKVKIKTKKKYKCPFCDERYDREHLVYHIERKHPEMIPQDYTSARVVFNYINKKDHGSCIVCGGETEWKEENWKYARLCKNPKCKSILSKKADENCKKKTGKTPRELLLDPEHQNKMLKGRRISGVYTFQDGGKRDYVGSYEKNILEFYDKFLNKKSDEIQTPGPVIEYMYKGEKHFWITDIYDITANLVMDVKDGGDNPNTREMKDYREKQIAKEKAITEQGQYNYLRLTNNNFEQLIQILSDLKMMMIDDTVKNHTISMINEYTALGAINPVIGSSGNYIVNYGVNGVFTGQAYTNDKALSKLYKIEDGKVKRKNTKEFLQEYDYQLYEYNDYKNIEIEEGMELNSFYELLTGNKYIDESQIMNDSRFKKTYSFYEYLESTNEVIRNSLIQEFNEYVGSPTLCIENTISDNQNEKIKVLQNENGYFIKNMISGLRSGYYDNEEDIPLSIKEIID